MLAWARLAGGVRSGTFFGDGAAARATREDLARQGDGAGRCDRALGGHAQVLLGVLSWPRFGGHPGYEGEREDGEANEASFHPGVPGRGGQSGREIGKSIKDQAKELGLSESALRLWMTQAEIDGGRGPAGALTTAEREELSRLRRENRTPKMGVSY